MKNKLFSSAMDAIYDIADGATIMMHSIIGPDGVAQSLIMALRERGVKNLTVICAATGLGRGVVEKPGLPAYITPNILIENGQVKKVISTWARRAMSSVLSTANSSIEQAILDGKLEWEPSSHGVLVERIRAGAAGLGGIYSPVGIGTVLERGKEKRVIAGKEYLFETALRADFAFVKAFKADKMGNLVYRGTARSFNPIMAMAADVTIVEADEIVEVGVIDAEHIVTPGVFVDRMISTCSSGGTR